MPHKSRYVAARTLIEEGWAVEQAMVEAADGSQRQGWRWTDPTGGVCHSFGKWANEPTKPMRAREGATWRMPATHAPTGRSSRGAARAWRRARRPADGSTTRRTSSSWNPA
jgi:hypothetical protein